MPGLGVKLRREYLLLYFEDTFASRYKPKTRPTAMRGPNLFPKSNFLVRIRRETLDCRGSLLSSAREESNVSQVGPID